MITLSIFQTVEFYVITCVVAAAVVALSAMPRRMDYNRHSPYASLIRDAKYRSMPALAREAGRCFALEMQSDAVAALSDIDVLLPVPVHWTKLLRRGYNQSREAAVISDAYGECRL